MLDQAEQTPFTGFVDDGKQALFNGQSSGEVSRGLYGLKTLVELFIYKERGYCIPYTCWLVPAYKLL